MTVTPVTPTRRRLSAFALVLAGGSGVLALVACNAILGTEERYFAEDADASPDGSLLDAARLDASFLPEADAAARDASAVSDASTDASDAAPSVDSGPEDPSLLASWTFDEDGGVVAHDGTGHGYDLTVSNGATIGGTGYFGTGALQFMPFMGQATSVALSSTGFPPVGTLSIWAFFDTVTTDQQRGIFDYYDESRHHLYLRYSAGDSVGQSSVDLDFAMEEGANFDFFASPKPVVSLGVWTHLVMVWDTVSGPATTQLYVDDKLPAQADATYTFGVGPLDETFILNNDFGGSYDDIYLWNRAMSAVEVASLPTK